MRTVLLFLLAFTTSLLLGNIANAQKTITLGSGTSTSSASSSSPSPYNEYNENQHMQFVYTASELRAAGASAGTISKLGWKVNSTINNTLPGYNIRMKHTKAVNASSHDGSNLKVVLRSYNYSPGKTGWQMISLDSTFYWDGKNNILIDVCYGALSSTGAAGSVYMYNNIPNQRRGDASGKGVSCSAATTGTFYMKPFIQFELDPDCAIPLNIKAENVTSNSATVKWDEALSGAQGYEYVLASTSGTPTSAGTFTTDTSIDFKGLCPSKLNFFYIRTICDKGDTTDWSNGMIFQTKSGGGITTNSPVCVGDTLRMSVEEAISYSWTGPNGFKSTDQNQLFPAAKPANAGNYTVLIEDKNKCNVTYAVTVRVDTLPVVNFDHNSPLCEANELRLNASGGDSYSWTGPDGFKSDTSYNSIADIKPKAAGFYLVAVGNSFNCMSMDSVEITVHELPTLSIQVTDTLCENHNIELSAITNGTVSWAGPQGFKGSMKDEVLKNAAPQHTGTYTATAVSNKSCERSESAKVLVKPAPNLQLEGDTVVCERTSFSLQGTGAIYYFWENDMGQIEFTGDKFTKSGDKSSEGSYTLVGQGSNACEAEIDFSISTLALPTIHAYIQDTLICAGDPVDFRVASQGVSGSWKGPNGFTSDLDNFILFPSSMEDEGRYVYTTTGSNGCENSDHADLKFKETPVIEIDKQGNNLVATSGHSNYTWYLNGQEIAGATGEIHTASEIGTYTVSTINDVQCSDTSDPVEVTSLGIWEVDFVTIRIYPNPAKGSFTLQSSEALNKVEIYTMLGELLVSYNHPDLDVPIDITNLSLGNYIVVSSSDLGVARSVLSVR